MKITGKQAFITFLLLLFFATHLSAQTGVSGVIKDAKNNTFLDGATLSIPDLKVRAVTDSAGYYSIKNISAGNYLIEIASVGYATQIERLTIKGNVQKILVCNHRHQR